MVMKIQHIVCYITGHGLGHATRCYAIIEEILRQGHRVTVVTARDLFIFNDLKSIYPCLHTRCSGIIDPGVIQSDAVTIDLEKTWQAQIDYHTIVCKLIESESKWLESIRPNICFLDATPYPAKACKNIGLPCVIATNFTFDAILQHLAEKPVHFEILEKIKDSYSECDGLLRLPGFIDMPVFDVHPQKQTIPDDNQKFLVPTPLVVRKPRKTCQQVRQELGIPLDAKVLLINFGAFQLTTKACDKVQLLPDGWVGITFNKSLNLDRFIVVDPAITFMPDIIECCDVVLGKCGYGVCSETLASKTPLLYVSRPQFIEEAGLLKMMGKLAIEMPLDKFQSGKWSAFVEEAGKISTDVCIDSNGAQFIAGQLLRRFTGKTDPLMEQFNASISFDKRMAVVDCTGSIAYAKALEKISLITPQELDDLERGLKAIIVEWKENKFTLKDSDEDIHTANERRLGELIGSVAGKLHTGRSRNDQVATDIRMYLRDSCLDLLKHLKAFINVALERALAEIDVIMPGYTHLQRAQPIRWSHWLLSHAWSLYNDLERLKSIVARFNKCPLGSGALAGNPFEIDREFLASELGFDGIIPNSLQAVSDRDFIAEFLFWSSLTMIHYSRFSEDLINFCTLEFGYVQLADAYSTGSSLMPQKKNPDSLELLRGKSGRAFGNMTGFMMTYKGLPSTYNKDLQEDKEPLFDSIDTLSGCIQISTGVLSTLKIHPDKMRENLSNDMLATDLAEYLVRKGVPFRQTHHISGKAVQMAEDRKCKMSELTLQDLKSLHELFDQDVFQVWDYEASIEKRSSLGGTSKKTVLLQIEQLKELINDY
ncbi:hypothetical protein HDV01_000837 [Terramyces sp. JEL0728]|nr:hypothetical protein HDV01_000837 [Terramyces sp. JEL0728]